MDIGLFLSSDDQASSDIAVTAGDLALDGTLQTAVLLSLLCDRVADADDIIPDGSTNRRGWWYDAYAPPLPDGTPDRSGSKLWLRVRCLADQQSALQIQSDCEQALQWTIATGVATDVIVSTSWASNNALNVGIVIVRQNAAGQPYNSAFNLIWDRTLGTFSMASSAASGVAQVIPPHLGLVANGIVPTGFGIVYSDGQELGIATIGNGLLWSPNTVTLSLGNLTWSNLPAAAQTSPLFMNIIGAPAASTRYLFSLPQNYTIPAAFAGTTTFQDVICTADTVFGISVISDGVETQLGTITLLPGGDTDCTLSSTGAHANAAADALVLTTPATQDATLSGVGIAFMLQRI